MEIQEEERLQADIFNNWAKSDYLQSTIDPRDHKGLKCDYINRWSHFYVKNIILKNQPSEVLEIGCGSGRNLFMLSPFIDRGYGIDIAELQIQNAELKKQNLGVANISFYSQIDSFLEANSKPEIAFTMWVVAGFSDDNNFRDTLKNYLENLPSIKKFIFFEQVSRETYTINDSKKFLKKVRKYDDFEKIFKESGLLIKDFKIINEKGFGPLYQLFYKSRIYKYIPKWFNMNLILFFLDRHIVIRKIYSTFTDSVFICERDV